MPFPHAVLEGAGGLCRKGPGAGGPRALAASERVPLRRDPRGDSPRVTFCKAARSDRAAVLLLAERAACRTRRLPNAPPAQYAAGPPAACGAGPPNYRAAAPPAECGAWPPADR